MKAYFLSAGIPADQIQSVHATFNGGFGGQAMDPATRSYNMFVTSHLTRAIGGVQVVESLAWATLDDNGESIGETVYWPEIPDSVVRDAAKLSASMKDDAQRSVIVARLPSVAVPTRVVIRHSSMFERGPFVAVACIDALVDQTTLHFDANGTEIRLPQETREAPATDRK